MMQGKLRKSASIALLPAAFLALMCLHSSCHALDSVSLEAGGGNHTQLLRLAGQWNWKRQWWQSNGTHIGGYWDMNVARWHGTRFENRPDATQDITALGITPVFRWQSDTGTGLYGEAGIGLRYLSKLYDNNGRQLSTNFEFASQLGAGYVFPGHWDIGLLFQHFSNGGIRHPNSGVNFGVVRLRYRF